MKNPFELKTTFQHVYYPFTRIIELRMALAILRPSAPENSNFVYGRNRLLPEKAGAGYPGRGRLNPYLTV